MHVVCSCPEVAGVSAEAREREEQKHVKSSSPCSQETRIKPHVPLLLSLLFSRG
jgi:hypothetical protein